MKLDELLRALPDAQSVGVLDLDITAITGGLLSISAGCLYVAVSVPTEKLRGAIQYAILLGAKVVVSESTVEVPPGVTAVCVQDVSAAFAALCARFEDEPSKRLRLVGITGTNGKTTTAFLVNGILRSAGHVAGMIGTVGYQVRDRWLPGEFTTPPADRYQSLLRTMVNEGVTHVVSEVSSHALAEKRVDNVDFDVAVFTNLTRDHLDFHGTMEDYFKAKRRLFDELLVLARKPTKCAVVNVDDPYGAELARTVPPQLRVITYSCDPISTADLRPMMIEQDAGGTRGTVSLLGKPFEIASPLLGKHNLANLLAAIGAGIAFEIDASVIVHALRFQRGAPGRLEPVPNPFGFAVLVDYAHTPDALERVLDTCRSLTSGADARVICVFGCGGDRDRGKRPVMGAVASRLADHVVITTDNARTEDAGQIAFEIAQGAEDPSRCEIVLDRTFAIEHAIAMASTGDVVLIAGKGHEAYQIVGSEARYFDDRREATRAVRRRGLDGRQRDRVLEPVASFHRSLVDVASAIGARVISSSDIELIGFGFFADKVEPGALFVLHPLSPIGTTGDVVDEAAARGAGAALVTEGYASWRLIANRQAPSIPLLVVDDIEVAMERLAGLQREVVESDVFHG